MAREVTVTGLSQIQMELNRRLSAIDNISNKSIEDVALDLLSKSVRKAPVDTGDLRGSGYAEKIRNKEWEVGYKGIPYALRQHEELNYVHPRGGEPKYLENPLKENIDRYIEHIKNNIQGAL